MELEQTPQQARETIAEWLRKGGIEGQRTLRYVEALEFDNRRLKEELRALKHAAAKRGADSSAMNSRLRDALRE